MNLRSTRRLLAVTAALGIMAAGLGSSLTANAAPSQTEIRLVTPVFTADNSFRNYDDPGYWVSQGWFPDGITYRTMYAPVGSTINLTYYVTDPATKQPLANTDVILRVNKGYSVSNAKVKVNDSAVTTGIERTGIDQLRVTAKTDQFGYVTFKMVDMDDPKDGAEPQPEAFNIKGKGAGQNPLGDPNIALYTQVKPEILGEKNDIVDFVDFHFYKPNAAPNPDLSSASASVITPMFDTATSMASGDVQQKYAEAGKSFALAYNIKDAKGAVLANKEVTVTVNKDGSGATAKVSTGTAAADGKPGTWTGMTDAYGTVVFTVDNKDVSGEAKPASPTAPVPASGALFARLTAAVTGVPTTSPTLDFHFWGAAKPTPTPTPKPTVKKTTITCIKGKLVKKVTAIKPKCPAGYKLKK